MNDKPNFSLVVYDDISNHSDEDGQVNVNSRGQGFYNLRQHIDPLRRYGDIATHELKRLPVSYVCKKHFCLLFVEISHLNIFIYFIFRNITFLLYTKKREKKRRVMAIVILIYGSLTNGDYNRGNYINGKTCNFEMILYLV